jgi:predicted 3-demethylubiquinone-9 3-methyltransferase (glyoxalase superfamily)
LISWEGSITLDELKKVPCRRFVPFLWFDGNAEEAMNFYPSIFKNSKIGFVSRYGEAGPGPIGAVMSATFELEGQQFIVLNDGPQVLPGNIVPGGLQDARRGR